MKIGIFLTAQHPPDSDIVAELEGQYAMVRLARDRGWDAVATGQHYLSEGVRQLQLVPFLARLAAEAGEMTGIAGVMLATLHNPVEIAECVASLDAIWRGNFVFGVGLGYREVEFDAFGVPKGRRVRRFEECLDTVKRLWTGEPVSFENEICKLSEVTATCRPVQQPHPPIWVAANSDAAVRRAARLGDSLFINPHATMPTIAAQMALYRAELARLGKPFPTVLPYLREIFCAKDKRTAVEMAGPYLAEKYRTYAQWGQDQVLPGQDSFRQSLDTLLRDRFILGSPEECYEELRPCWEEAGANFLIFRSHWSGMPVAHALSSMRLISDELLPALRRVKTGPRG
ncbi:MAG TPA: LLM class flavin-dependent oxidoreductase [Stellaceae bacterium]|jgi:alkanesulfonate monooxygenase SsuD/methylene tetrahydromethanopterin reductase-like flavin-dependent oxidoreductase (luciferase family)